MKKRVWRIIYFSTSLIIIFIGFVIAESYFPHEVGFQSDEPEVQKKIEEIVSIHGFNFRHDINVRGETMVIIEDITSNEHQKLMCEFYKWSDDRYRKKGVTVYEREDCAL
jgi:hypothetical protein